MGRPRPVPSELKITTVQLIFLYNSRDEHTKDKDLLLIRKTKENKEKEKRQEMKWREKRKTVQFWEFPADRPAFLLKSPDSPCVCSFLLIAASSAAAAAAA